MFSNVLSRRSSPLNSAWGSFSRVSLASVGFIFDPIVVAMKKRDFVVRAESNSEGEAGAAENAEESEAVAVEEPSEVKAEGESEAGAEKEAALESDEAKPPRKPRVKLGDIMGVLYLMLFPFVRFLVLCLIAEKFWEKDKLSHFSTRISFLTIGDIMKFNYS